MLSLSIYVHQLDPLLDVDPSPSVIVFPFDMCDIRLIMRLLSYDFPATASTMSVGAIAETEVLKRERKRINISSLGDVQRQRGFRPSPLLLIQQTQASQIHVQVISHQPNSRIPPFLPILSLSFAFDRSRQNLFLLQSEETHNMEESFEGSVLQQTDDGPRGDV